MTVEGYNVVQRTTVQVRLASDSTRVINTTADTAPILGTLNPQQSRVDYYSGVWWETLSHHLSLATDSLIKRIKLLDIDYPLTDREAALQLLAEFAIQDLNDARSYIEDPPSETLSFGGDDDIEAPWAFFVWLIDRLRRIQREQLLKLAAALLKASRSEFQTQIRYDLRSETWWEEDRVPALHELGTYRRGDVSSWFVTSLVDEILQEFLGSKVSYLGPIRKSPKEPILADRRQGKDLGTSGEYAAAVLNAHTDVAVVVPLPDGYESELPLGEALNWWLDWFGLADDAIARDRGRLGVDLNVSPPGASTSVDLASVGVGVSQVLPVILLCLLSEPEDLLILEQPELHLHPALQKRMADFLLVFVRAGRQILVETHSDHLVNQLRYQIAADQTDEIQKLVKLVFAEQKDGITTYRESEINEYGGLSEDWPDGFLDISAKSAQDLVRHGLRKWKLRKPRLGEGN